MLRSSRRRIAAALVAVCLALLATSTQAQGQPERVFVGVHLLSVGRIDLASGGYTADFYVHMRCESRCALPDLELANGRGTVERYVDEPNRRVLRVFAELHDSFPLHRYPFDRQDMQIVLEDRARTVDALVLVPDPPNTAADDAVVVPGWIVEQQPTSAVDRHVHPTEAGATFSRYTFRIHMYRPWLSSVLKVLVPALFILLAGLTSLVVAMDDRPYRITIVTAALVGSVLFHNNVTSSLPPVPYLTVVDRVMLVQYATLLVALAVAVYGLLAVQRGDDARAVRLARGAVRVIPPAWLVAALGATVLG